MFCPKCAAQNIDGAHFCRACGANISLVPHALSGQLPVATSEESESRRRGRRKHREQQPTLDQGVRNVVMGFGFVALAIALAFWGRPIGATFWWFFMLIPAATKLGQGISEILRANQLKASQQAAPQQLPFVAPPERLPQSNTNELRPPVASVTEGTTRHLGTDAATRHFDSIKRES